MLAPSVWYLPGASRAAMMSAPVPAPPGVLTRAGQAMHERRAARPAGRGYPGPLDAGLSGTGLVADDLYLLAHDDRTGKPLLPPRPLGTGLAGALLTELMLTRCIGLRSDTAVVIGQDVPQTAVAGHVLLKLIADEPSPLAVRTWLGFLSQTAARDVALRLEQAGYLRRLLMSTHAAPARASTVSRALARDKLGVFAVLAFILASIAPMTVAAGVIPTAYAA